MKRGKYKPAYNLTHVKNLCSSGKLTTSGRVFSYLANHYGRAEFKATLLAVMANLKESEFYKSDPLEVAPGYNGDVYKTHLDDEDWYIKFYVRSNGAEVVVVLTACQDGSIH